MSVAILEKIFLSHDGTGHKIAHNLTTLSNVPLVAWFIYAVFTLRNANYEEVTAFISEPFHLVTAILFVYVSLKHFTLEVEVVFEDYVSNISLRHLIIIAMKIFALVLGLTTTISLLKIGL